MRRGPWLIEGIFIAAEVPGAPLATALANARASAGGTVALENCVERVLGLHADLEAREVFHPDLHGGNLIVRTREAGDEFTLVDLHAIRLLGRCRRGLPWWRERMRAKLAFSLWKLLDRREFEAVLEKLAPGLEARLLEKVHDMERRRLRSRSRRCVLRSSGFRLDRRGAWRVWRRREVPCPELIALADSGVSGPQRLRVDGELLEVCVWRRSWPGWLSEWKNLHALGVRGVPVPRAHACLSRRRLGGRCEAVLVTEDLRDLQRLAGDGVAKDPGSLLNAALATAERLHGHGLSARPARLRVREGPSGVQVLALPMETRIPDRELPVEQRRVERDRLRAMICAADGI